MSASVVGASPPGILALPNELLACIADLLDDSSSAASLALTCVRLHSVAFPSLCRSLGFDGPSGTVSNSISWTLAPPTDCLASRGSNEYLDVPRVYPRVHRLCQAVIARAKISDYIKELSFTGFSPRSLTRGTLEPVQLRFSQAEQDYLLQLVQTLDLPEPTLWNRRIETSDTETAVILLAAQLNHTLRGLRLDGVFALADLLCMALTRPGGPLLPHLEHIHLPTGSFVPAEVAACIVQRPRMRSIKLSIESGERFVWPELAPASARFLTALSLTVEHTEPGMLLNILSASPDLKHLHYVFCGNIDGPQALRLEEGVLQMDLDEFTFAVQLVSGTLVSLTVRIGFVSDATHYVERSLYWGVQGSLRFTIPFPYLEDITLPVVAISQNRTSTHYHTSNPFPRQIRNITFTNDASRHANEVRSLEDIEWDIEELFEDWRNDFPGLQSLTIPPELKGLQELLDQLQLPYSFAAS